MADQLLFNITTSIVAIFVILVLVKNIFFLILAPWYGVIEKLRQLRSGKTENAQSSYNPKVSVIVPAWNEEVGLLKTVTSALYNGYENIQVVVINDGSTDNSHNLMTQYIEQLSLQDPAKARRITYQYQENGGKGVALNKGISLSTGDIILTVDADSQLRRGSIQNLVKYYRDSEIMAVVGNVRVTNTKTLIGLAQHLEYYFGFYNKRTHAVLGAEYIFGGACASFRREVFETVGLFDTENKTEDIEMSMRVRFHGYKCTYAEDVICYTEGASDVKGLLAQRVRWKKGRLDTFYKYRSMFFSTDDKHNFFLSYFILPISLLTEIQLIFEPIAIAILLIYSLITFEFVSIAIGILFILLSYIVTAFFSNGRIRLDLILLFPFTWPLFYFLDWVEFVALFKSLNMYRQKEDVVWQSWKRVGI